MSENMTPPHQHEAKVKPPDARAELAALRARITELEAERDRLRKACEAFRTAIRCYDYDAPQRRCDGVRPSKPTYGTCEACHAAREYDALANGCEDAK